MKRMPLLPTIVVLAAIGVMIGLGVWQVNRAGWKDDLKQRYAAASGLPPIAWPGPVANSEDLPLFRHASAYCRQVVARRVTAGESASGDIGYVHIADCADTPGQAPLSIEIGWSRDPNARTGWSGGPVSGIIAPDRIRGMRLVAATAAPGLEPVRAPSLAAIPDNHLFYAFQWFFFAGLAGLIYALALRRRSDREPIA